MSVGGSSAVRKVSVQEELVPSKRQKRAENRERGNSDDAAQIGHSRRGDRPPNPVYDRPKSSTPVTTQPVSDPVPIEAPPPVADVPSSSDLQSLAAQYVDLYSKQTGRTLTTEQRSSLVADVYSFYSDPSRSGRLKSLVDAGA